MTFVLGIDPGISGAIAFIPVHDLTRVAVEDVPVAGGEINVPELANIIRTYRPMMAVIERAQAFRGQGVSSTFNYGRSYGDVRGVIGALDIQLHMVAPSTWKRHFKLSADKEQCRMYAIRMFPVVADHFKLKRHHGRAEAALIALYGTQVLASRVAA